MHLTPLIAACSFTSTLLALNPTAPLSDSHPAAAIPQSAASAAASTSEVPWPADDAGLQTLGNELITSAMRRFATQDFSGMESAWLPCYQSIRFAGPADRDESLKVAKGLAITDTPKITQVRATRAGDALVVTCLAAVGQTIGGERLAGTPAPRLGVWQFDGGAWKVAAWANLNMPTERPAPAAPAFPGDASLNAQGAAMLQTFLGTQQRKDIPAYEKWIDPHAQVVNFRGQIAAADLQKGVKAATSGVPTLHDARTTRCGGLTVVTCNLSMSQDFGLGGKLPADPAPFLAVFSGTGDTAKVIALANTNKPR